MSLPLLGPQMLLHAYACGLFPMAASYTSDRVLWVDPEQRGILPLHRFHVSRSMKRVLKKHPFDVHIDRAFERVVRACAERCEERHDTWLTPPIQEMHLELYKMGHAHSVECWQNNQLVGGLYGIHIGGFFAGETMFSRVSESSKVALCYLIAHLKQSQCTLLDVQFLNHHLQRFGAIEITRKDYLTRLRTAVQQPKTFARQLSGSVLSILAQSTNHTS